jgi:hypothetical protein
MSLLSVRGKISLSLCLSPLKRKLGAGIGGLALAMGLHKKGIHFTLYEEAKQFSAVG